MGVDDLFSTESAVVAAATAAVFSPRTRETMRRGAVLGVAGAMKVGDVVAGAARGAARGVQGVAQDAQDVAEGVGQDAEEVVASSTQPRSRRSSSSSSSGRSGRAGSGRSASASEAAST